MRGRVMGGLTAGAALLLAACGGEAPADEAVAGGGEVLEGTASDAMLPLATVTSQPPLAPPEPEPARRGAAPAATPTGDATPSPASVPTGDAAVPAATATQAPD